MKGTLPKKCVSQLAILNEQSEGLWRRKHSSLQIIGACIEFQSLHGRLSCTHGGDRHADTVVIDSLSVHLTVEVGNNIVEILHSRFSGEGLTEDSLSSEARMDTSKDYFCH